MQSQSYRKSATSAVTYNDSGAPRMTTATTIEDDGTPEPTGNPLGRGHSPMNPGGGTPAWPEPITTETPGPGAPATGSTPSGVVGPPTIDAAAQARDRQDSVLRRRGRRDFLPNGAKGSGIPDVVIAGLTGLDGNPNRRKPGYTFPGGRHNPTVPDNPSNPGNPTRRGPGGPLPTGGPRRSYNSFS